MKSGPRNPHHQRHNLASQTTDSQNGCNKRTAVSEDHGQAAPHTTERDTPPLFLTVRPGPFVVVSETPNVVMTDKTTWSVARVIWCEGGAGNPAHTTMFQVMDVDSGVVKWVNADDVTHVLPSLAGLEK